jgi:hypothetical protein
VWNDTRVWHADAKSVLAFLDIARIDTREGNTNPNIACLGMRIIHLADDEHIPRSACFSYQEALIFVRRSSSPSPRVEVLATRFGSKLHNAAKVETTGSERAFRRAFGSQQRCRLR